MPSIKGTGQRGGSRSSNGGGVPRPGPTTATTRKGSGAQRKAPMAQGGSGTGMRPLGATRTVAGTGKKIKG